MLKRQFFQNLGEYLGSSDDDYMNSPIRKKKHEEDDSQSEEIEEPDLETLSAAIKFEVISKYYDTMNESFFR